LVSSLENIIATRKHYQPLENIGQPLENIWSAYKHYQPLRKTSATSENIGQPLEKHWSATMKHWSATRKHYQPIINIVSHYKTLVSH
jgi:hypothetical protein